MARPWSRLISRAYKLGDSPEDKAARRSLIPVFTVGFTVTPLLQAIVSSSRGWHMSVGAMAAILLSVVCFVITCTLSCSSRKPREVLGPGLLFILVGLLMVDLQAASRLGTRFWTFAVVYLDCALVFSVHDTYTRLILVIVCLWLTVDAAESAFRFGLYDSTYPFGGPDETKIGVCDCEDPPCAVGVQSLSGVFLYLCVFLMDFHFTRGFAVGVQKQLALVRASVSVAERLALLLSRYEVELAEIVVQEGGELLPKQLHVSFNAILQNLKQYKAYLPQSCLETGLVASPGFDSPEPEPDQEADVHLRLSRSYRSDLSDSRPVRTPALSPLCRPPREARVTLLCLNHVGFLSQISQHGTELTQWMTDEVSMFLTDVCASAGVVDLVNGDHFFASFNAVRSVPRHQVRALTAAWDLTHASPQAPVSNTCAVASGKALCGDFGTSSCRRFMVVGGLSNLLYALDRLAVRFSEPILADRNVFADAQLHWQMRLQCAAVFRKAWRRKPILLYTVGGAKDDEAKEEWMYAVDAQSDADSVNSRAERFVDGLAHVPEGEPVTWPCPAVVLEDFSVSTVA
eukprot:TRINITY_DN6149_c0_g1_i1.p1 TRINITY_DN6149_c0_g1~~TRINITY_DN6149_c0_g1_i1.p1  ORF type:complete len:590 (+),score=73.15 TRINITY_DN6149_c0_g1_i1:55-1770(+)